MRSEILLLAGLFACSGSDKTSTIVTDPGLDTTPLDVEAFVSRTMPTVVTVRWRTADPSVGHVTFGEGALQRTTRQTAEGTEHEVQLVALAPETDISYQIVSGESLSEEAIVTTGVLPVTVPDFTVEGDGQDHFTVLALLDDLARPVVLDPQGRVVWMYNDTRPGQVFRAKLSLDGSGLVYSSTLEQGLPSEDSVIVRVSWEGEETAVWNVPELSHDFVELPDGTLVTVASDWRGEVEGNKLVSIAADGTTTDLWSAWDCIDPETNPSRDPTRPDWTHSNALDYDLESDAFLIGFRNLNTILHVDRATGACDWGLGGSGGDVEITGSKFIHQHQFHKLDGKMLVFDNDGAFGSSRVLEYDFDEAAGTAVVIDEFRADPPLYSFILGDVHRLPDGDTQIIWATEGTIDRLQPDGTRHWRATFPGFVLGFSEMHVEPGRPGALE